MNEAAVLAEMYDLITVNKRQMFDRIASDRTKHVTVVLENVYQDHNASAVLRTCDCFGIQDLHVIEKNFRYEVKRDIALGAGRWVDLHQFNEGNTPDLDCIRELKEKGYRIVATTPHTEDRTIHDLELDQSLAIVFGTERRGISTELLELADEHVKIPMYGFTESLNVSVAAAITMEVIRERLERSDINWRLSEDEQIALKLKWCRKIVKGGDALEEKIRERIFEKE